VNATVTCSTNPSGYDCGNVIGNLRYNNSVSTTALINSTKTSKPFYITDLDNEIAIALFETTNELRFYENKSGGWVETNITDLSDRIEAIDIGDANNDGLIDIVVGMDAPLNKVVLFENKSGGWVETEITDVLGLHIETIRVGDVDNDGLNEIAIGLVLSLAARR